MAAHRAFLRRHLERFHPPALENFLCFATRFQADERLTVEQALNHLYFAGFDAEAFLAAHRPALGAQLRLFVRGERAGVPQFYAANILARLAARLLKGERWFALRDAFAEVEGEDGPALHRESPELEHLLFELGVDMDFLWARLCSALSPDRQSTQLTHLPQLPPAN